MRNKAQTELVKGLGVFGATSVVAGTMIGTAIFVVPGIMLQQVGTPSMVLVVWVAAGVLSLFGALAMPSWARRCRRRAANSFTCTALTAPCSDSSTAGRNSSSPRPPRLPPSPRVLSSTSPTSSRACTKRCGELLSSLGGHGLDLRLTGLQLGATLMVLLLSGLNILGVRRSGAVQTFFTASKLLVLADPHRAGPHLRSRLVAGVPPVLRGGRARRPAGGLRRGHGLSALGLRWMEQSQHGGGRSQESPTQHAPGADRRGAAGSHRLCPGEPRVLLRAARFPGSGHEHRGVRRRAPLPGQRRGSVRCRGRHDFHLRHAQRLDPGGLAHSLRHRARAAFSRPRWPPYIPASTLPPCRWWGRPSSRDCSR